jgi:diguanylate cyclase (GGDEF)-like protein
LELHISGPARNKIDKTWALFATRRLDHADGSFAGVAMAPISLDYFAQTYATADVGRLGIISLFSEDGTLMVRRPPAFVGHRFPEVGSLVGRYKHLPAGWFIRRSDVDGTIRLFAFRRVLHYPLTVSVGIAESGYLTDWQSGVRANAGVLALISALIAGLAAALGTQIRGRKRVEDELARLALLDGLTGLANRRRFDTVFEREWCRAARDRLPLALMMIDVDHFKSYNDLYGHHQGDKALILIAREIAAGTRRPGDLAARYGGEEFALILTATDASSAATVAERIRSAVVALNITHASGEQGTASVSIGVAGVVPPLVGDGSTLIEAADTALYDAKRTGRNRTSVTTLNGVHLAPAAGTDDAGSREALTDNPSM